MSNLTAQFSYIFLATDHAGFAHKEAVKAWLLAEGFLVRDFGAYEYDAADDFPVFINQAAAAVAGAETPSAGLIFGGSGEGEAMAANRYKKVRATVYYGGDEAIIKLSREHNHANVLAIGARFVSIETSKRIIWDWLHTPTLSDTKYARRNQMLDQ